MVPIPIHAIRKGRPELYRVMIVLVAIRQYQLFLTRRQIQALPISKDMIREMKVAMEMMTLRTGTQGMEDLGTIHQTHHMEMGISPTQRVAKATSRRATLGLQMVEMAVGEMEVTKTVIRNSDVNSSNSWVETWSLSQMTNLRLKRLTQSRFQPFHLLRHIETGESRHVKQLWLHPQIRIVLSNGLVKHGKKNNPLKRSGRLRRLPPWMPSCCLLLPISSLVTLHVKWIPSKK